MTDGRSSEAKPLHAALSFQSLGHKLTGKSDYFEADISAVTPSSSIDEIETIKAPKKKKKKKLIFCRVRDLGLVGADP